MTSGVRFPPRPAPILLLSVSFGLAFSGCGEAPGENGGPTTTVDTVAGVVHVRHAGQAPEWLPERVLALGELGGLTDAPSPEEFGKVVSVLADERGTMFVADGLANEVRVFDRAGEFLRRLGRKGGGPGEIGGLRRIAWLGPDTLVVMDPENARLMRLTTAGEDAGQWSWVRLSGGSTRFLFNGGPGELYAHAFRPRRGEEGGLDAVWVRYTAEGPRDSLDVLRSDPPTGTAVTCRGDGIGFFTNPYGGRMLAVPAPGAERVVAWASRYRLAFVDGSGDTLRTITREIEPVPLTDDEWDEVDERYREFQGWWRDARCEGDIARPEHRPVLLDIFFDHEGRTFVEHNTPDGLAFDLFDPDGRWVATIPVPERDRSVPPYLRGDRLYLTTRDSLDVQRVEAHRLQSRQHNEFDPRGV